jgi:hypothetical protein
LIHFATRPGSVAADGTGSNGLYTSQLLRFIDSPDLPVETMLKRVSAAVTVESKKQRERWTEGSIVGEFYFKPGATLTTVKPEPVTSDAQVELQAWTAAQSGNAWEWVQDVWHENHQGAPVDGSAWLSGGDQVRRVLRGGAWFNYPRNLRSANRFHSAPVNRNFDTGMRIAGTY